MSGKIDDPLEASSEMWPEDPEGLGNKFGELALTFMGLKFPLAAVLKILKDQFLPTNRLGRIKYLFDGMAGKLKILESEHADSRDRLKEIQARLESPQFQEAVATACEAATHASNLRRIGQLASVLVGSLIPSQWANQNEDVAAMIRDVEQPGDQDIQALDLLKVIFAPVIAHLPNLNDPNQFTGRMQDYRTAIAQAATNPEDFYATCVRLTGFGLAIEVLRNPSSMQIHEYCFRPTRRGLALLEYLERFDAE